MVCPCFFLAIQLYWNFELYCSYFFPKSASPNWRCGLSKDAAYTGTFTVTISQRGIITLTPKKNKDKTVLDNWRPISLLNTDYKIATRAIALRISKILPNIIHSDQTLFNITRLVTMNDVR